MLRTVELLDLARARQGGVSDYRLAQLLGVKQPTLSCYRIGRSVPNLSTLARLCELAEVDLRCAVLWNQVERADSAEAAELLRKLSTDAEARYLPPGYVEECRSVAVDNAVRRSASPALARAVARLQV